MLSQRGRSFRRTPSSPRGLEGGARHSTRVGEMEGRQGFQPRGIPYKELSQQRMEGSQSTISLVQSHRQEEKEQTYIVAEQEYSP